MKKAQESQIVVISATFEIFTAKSDWTILCSKCCVANDDDERNCCLSQIMQTHVVAIMFQFGPTRVFTFQ